MVLMYMSFVIHGTYVYEDAFIVIIITTTIII